MKRKYSENTVVAGKAIRCAIYTRKSTEEGLEQDFNTLDAQRESAEAYIASQKSEGWAALPDRYDDGGFSGGNMERPALKRLLADADAGRVDCIIVYKVDRLSRSLLDFARIMETLDRRKVSFVSVSHRKSNGIKPANWLTLKSVDESRRAFFVLLRFLTLTAIPPAPALLSVRK